MMRNNDTESTETKISRRKFVQGATAAGITGATAGCTGQLQGNSYPSKKIEMICPWAAGGGTDRTARKLANLAGNHMDTSFYVTNKTGGSGSVGFNAVANAEPNGYTVGVLTVEVCTISHLGISDVSPDDFAAVMQYNFDPASLTVPEDAPYDTIGEFVDYAKDNPGEIKISNSGIGAIWHLSAAGFAQETGIDVKHVGYDGGAPATKAVVNGEVDATTASAAEVAPQVKDGPLKVLGVMGDKRVSIFPEVPTLKEKGIDFRMGAWRGLAVPKGTDEKRVTKLHDAYKGVYDSDKFKKFMNNNGFGMVYRSSDEFSSFMDDQYKKFEGIIKKLDL